LIELIPRLTVTYELLTKDTQKMYDDVMLRRDAMAAENEVQE
jgi:hypothetical protein